MSSLNMVQLIGNVGRDPEVRTFNNGGKVCNLSLATSERWKDRNTGEKRERTEWHSVAIFSEGAVRFAEQYIRKGAKVYVQGKLETRKWQDQSGQDRYTTEVVIRPYSGDVKLLASVQTGGQQGAGGGTERSYGSYHGDQQGGADKGAGPSYGEGRDLDDEIPF